MPRLSLIVAVADNGVIGHHNALPWRLPEDVAFFKRTTVGHTVVMGRRTFESIGQALRDRRNLVVTRTPGWSVSGVEAFESLDAALEACATDDEVFVIGGQRLFDEALGRADRLLVTCIHRSYAGDIYFPAIPPHFQEVARSAQTAAADPSLRFDFVTYQRVPAPT